MIMKLKQRKNKYLREKNNYNMYILKKLMSNYVNYQHNPFSNQQHLRVSFVNYVEEERNWNFFLK